MKAILTFVRKYENNLNLIALDNCLNLNNLTNINLISGQPILIITNNEKIFAFYLIKNNGDLYQIYGEKDYLFEIDKIHDYSIINLSKYNLIKYFLSNIFLCLSISEFQNMNKDMSDIENKIFHDLLHAELDLHKIKAYIYKIIRKSNIKFDVKQRLLINLKNTKFPNNRIFLKKIDLNLLGYDIYINTLIK